MSPTNMRNFRQKRTTFWKKGVKRVRYRQTPKHLENRKNKNFCLIYFPKLNRDLIEKKLYRFEDVHYNKKRKIWQKYFRESDMTCINFVPTKRLDARDEFMLGMSYSTKF